MNKKIIVATLVVVMLMSCVLVFAGCAAGTYTGPTGLSEVKLSAFGGITYTITVGSSKSEIKGKYKTEKKTDNGNTPISIVWENENKETSSMKAGFIDKDGNLWFGSIKYTKK